MGIGDFSFHFVYRNAQKCRKGNSTIHHIHAINHVTEKSTEYLSQPLQIVKGFDSAKATTAMEALWDHTVEGTYTELLEELYKECLGTIFHNSQMFLINKGVRQGCMTYLK